MQPSSNYLHQAASCFRQNRTRLFTNSPEAELNAAVEEAAARGTYVMAHVYTDEGVRRCLKAGVRSIEHANFVNEKTVAMMAEYGAYFDPTFISLVQRIESANETHLSASIVDNIRRTVAKGKQVYAWAKELQRSR